MIEQMSGDEMLTRKIELILEMNSKKLMSEVTQLRSELASVKAMLEQRPREAPRGSPVQQTVVSVPQEAKEAPVATLAKPVEKPIDRNNVAPSSVSIEKIFYYGNK